MPSHFQMTRRGEAHDQRAIGLILHDLSGVKFEAPGMRGSARGEAPDHFAELFLILENTEGAIGEESQIEGRIALEGLPANLRCANLFPPRKDGTNRCGPLQGGQPGIGAVR